MIIVKLLINYKEEISRKYRTYRKKKDGEKVDSNT